MRPDSYAKRPASTANFMARAILTESSAAVGEVHAAHGDGHHFRARSFVTTLHLLETAILPRPYDKPRTEFATRNCKGLGHTSMVLRGGYGYR
jgi:hypothetical protein